MDKAKPAARQGRKATGLEKIAGLPNEVARFFIFMEKSWSFKIWKRRRENEKQNRFCNN